MFTRQKLLIFCFLCVFTVVVIAEEKVQLPGFSEKPAISNENNKNSQQQDEKKIIYGVTIKDIKERESNFENILKDSKEFGGDKDKIRVDRGFDGSTLRYGGNDTYYEIPASLHNLLNVKYEKLKIKELKELIVQEKDLFKKTNLKNELATHGSILSELLSSPIIKNDVYIIRAPIPLGDYVNGSFSVNTDFEGMDAGISVQTAFYNVSPPIKIIWNKSIIFKKKLSMNEQDALNLIKKLNTNRNLENTVLFKFKNVKKTGGEYKYLSFAGIGNYTLYADVIDARIEVPGHPCIYMQEKETPKTQKEPKEPIGIDYNTEALKLALSKDDSLSRYFPNWPNGYKKTVEPTEGDNKKVSYSNGKVEIYIYGMWHSSSRRYHIYSSLVGLGSFWEVNLINESVKRIYN